MTDSAWIEAMRALLPGPEVPLGLYENDDGLIDRQRTIEHFETVLGVRVPEELRNDLAPNG